MTRFELRFVQTYLVLTPFVIAFDMWKVLT